MFFGMADMKRIKHLSMGETLDGEDIRIIIAFDEFGMLIITVMHVL